MILAGIFLIVYIAFGLIYWQQGSKQEELKKQNAQISLIVDNPLQTNKELQAEYNRVNFLLTPIEDVDAIAMLVDIADRNGINIDPSSDRVRIPSAVAKIEKLKGGIYEILSFNNISVRGDYNRVMAFISDLDLGITKETIVLRKFDIRQDSIEGEDKGMTMGSVIATLDVDFYMKP
ncbi:hypothetical protein ACFLYC_02370 [Chloroflexota bacterium]